MTADSFHRLCARANFLLNSRNLAVPEDEEQKAAFWDSEAPMLLLQAVEEKKLGPFDAVIVDEGQDFASSWWDVLEEMLAEDGRMLVFYDPSQRIFKKGDSAPPAVGV